MTMAQVENDHPMTNGCENTNGDLHIEPIDLSSPISNGIVGTPSKCVEGNGELTDGQLSPASLRRRSTRVSALKAQEKIKLKDDIVAAGQLNRGSHDEDDDDESAPKKRRLDDGSAFDQFSHKFGIRQQEDNVYPLTDESEISSLHESEIVGLKVSYDKLMSKELSEEQKRERNMMIKKCEAELRLEEAKLTMLKKIKASQMLATQKPLVATPIGNKPSATTATTNGKSANCFCWAVPYLYCTNDVFSLMFSSYLAVLLLSTPRQYKLCWWLHRKVDKHQRLPSLRFLPLYIFMFLKISFTDVESISSSSGCCCCKSVTDATSSAAAAAMNPAALMSNPALLRQFQQMNQQNRNLIESMRGKK
uniref:P66_CC domain-containing protein n=1 Tax=Heterorhabditis bacteriophora TaxID=37862 RepID=A0A1I7XHT4_HETBA